MCVQTNSMAQSFPPVAVRRRAWHKSAMFGCNTVCPKCRHEFRCCPPVSHGGGGCTLTAINRRSLHGLSGGGLVQDQHQSDHHFSSVKPNMLFTQSAAAQCRSAQISPSAPVSFVLPFPPPPQLDAAESRPETEFQRLKESVRLLQESGWYHEGLSWQQSQSALKHSAPGTFLIRDSSDPKFLYALSVQTEQGPTSVRLHYVSGKFRLDSEPYLAPLMPLFNSVLDLCVYYVKCSVRNSPPPAPASAGTGGGGQVWVDANGCLFSRILLRRPLLRADRVPTLQHLARLAVHGALETSSRPRLALLPPPHTQLELPTRLAEYLAEYPYSL